MKLPYMIRLQVKLAEARLYTLCFSFCPLGPSGGHLLSRVLPLCLHLQELDLCFAGLTDTGAVSVAQGLDSLHNLKVLL